MSSQPGLPLVRRLAEAVANAKSTAASGNSAAMPSGQLQFWQHGAADPLRPLSLGSASAAWTLVPDIAAGVAPQAADRSHDAHPAVHQAIARNIAAFSVLNAEQKALARDLIYNALLCLDQPAGSPWRLSERQFIQLLEATPAFVQRESAASSSGSATRAFSTRTTKLPLRVILPNSREPLAEAHRLLAPYLHASGAHTVVDLSGLDLRNGELLAALGRAFLPSSTLIDLSGANLQGVSIPQLQLPNAVLDGANLRGAVLVGAHLEKASLRGADLRDTNLTRAQLSGADLSGARADGAVLSHASLAGAMLDGSSLLQATLINANLGRARLTGADLAGAQLQGARASNADFERSLLQGADLSYARLTGAHFRDAVLADVNFNEALLVGTDFRQSRQSRVHWGAADTTQARGVHTPAATTTPPRAAHPPQRLARAAADGLLAKHGVTPLPEHHRAIQDLLLVAMGRQAQLGRDGGLLSSPAWLAAELHANTSSVAAQALHLVRLDGPSSARVVQAAIDSLAQQQAWSRQAPGGQVPTRLQAQQIAGEPDPIKRACMVYLALVKTTQTLDRQWALFQEQPTNPTPASDTAAGLALMKRLADEATPLAELFTSQWGLQLPLGPQDTAQRQRLALQADIIGALSTINRRLHIAALQRQRIDPAQLNNDLSELQALSVRVEAATQQPPQATHAAPPGGWSEAQRLLNRAADRVEEQMP